MENYIDITQSSVFVGFIGLITPFLFPFLFKVVGKWIKRELTHQEKRVLIVWVSLLVSLAVVAVDFDWQGEFINRLYEFIMYLALNFTILRGIVQSVYELIIKNFPEIDERMKKIEEIK